MNKSKYNKKMEIIKENKIRRKLPKGSYAFAIEAHHKLGDISRPDFVNIRHVYENVCHLVEEDKENYYGSWVTGMGFFDVRFPKSTTRGLTKEEIEVLQNQKFAINNQPSWGIDIKNTI